MDGLKIIDLFCIKMENILDLHQFIFCPQLTMFLKALIKSFTKKKSKKSNKSFENEFDYDYWKELFEAAKLKKNVFGHKETSAIDSFLSKYCLDEFSSGDEEEDSSSGSDDANESFEDTVSWQYFNICDESTVSDGSSTNSSFDASFHPDNCSTLIKSFQDQPK